MVRLELAVVPATLPGVAGAVLFWGAVGTTSELAVVAKGAQLGLVCTLAFFSFGNVDVAVPAPLRWQRGEHDHSTSEKIDI